MRPALTLLTLLAIGTSVQAGSGGAATAAADAGLTRQATDVQRYRSAYGVLRAVSLASGTVHFDLALTATAAGAAAARRLHFLGDAERTDTGLADGIRGLEDGLLVRVHYQVVGGKNFARRIEVYGKAPSGS